MSNSRLRRFGLRTLVVGVALTGSTALATATATGASAIVKNPNTLCADHGGVETVYRKARVVVCNDGEEFDI